LVWRANAELGHMTITKKCLGIPLNFISGGPRQMLVKHSRYWSMFIQQHVCNTLSMRYYSCPTNNNNNNCQARICSYEIGDSTTKCAATFYSIPK
jgi:hypothetical protein